MNDRDSQMEPRNGLKLKVIFVCRVSDTGPGKQDERSLDDQEAMYRTWMKDHMKESPYEATVIAGSGSGEYLEREEYLRLIELVETGAIDFVLTEDIGRIIRRIHAHLFCELCVDCGTRLIAINDHVDTAEHGWQDRSIFSAWHHERSNRDTSDRIKRSHLGRFDIGRCAPCEIYGVIIPRGKDKTDADWRKDPDAEPIYREWFKMLDTGSSYADVADWLNEKDVPVGPHCRKEKWDCRMVGRITHNTILKGVRYRNRYKTRRHRNGKYISEKANPDELRTREVPHLAFLEPAYYDRIIAKLQKENEEYSRGGKNGQDPLQGIPKRRTRFPGQIIQCGICGRLYVFGGHGERDRLMCTGAREHLCWNGITVDGPTAAEKIATVVLETVSQLPDFDQAFLNHVNEEALQEDQTRQDELAELNRRYQSEDRKRKNYVKFIGEGDSSSSVREEISKSEAKLKEIKKKIEGQESIPSDVIEVPGVEELKSLAYEEFRGPAPYTWEFNKIMQRLIPKIVVFPYRLIDGGHIVLRARFRLFLGQLLPDSRLQQVLKKPLGRELTVDLFEPPQREAFREQVVNLRNQENEKMSEKTIANHLGITVTAAQRAAALQRKMDALKLNDPYQPVTEPPEDYTKLRRHKHKRYRFDPLPDAGEY